jgi:hypothetical protein
MHVPGYILCDLLIGFQSFVRDWLHYLLGVDPWSSLQQLVICGDFRGAVLIDPITEVVLAIEITTNVVAFFLVISLATAFVLPFVFPM